MSSNFVLGPKAISIGSPALNVGPNPTGVPKGVKGLATAIIYSVDNANAPDYCSVLINNQTPPVSGYAMPFGGGPWAVAGTSGYDFFWNNSSGLGGTIVTVDQDTKTVVAITTQVSTVAPTQSYATVNDHLHVGNLNPPKYGAVSPITFGGTAQPYTYAYIKGSQVPLSPVLTTGNIISSAFTGVTLEVSGPYTGLYQQTAGTITSSQKYVISPYSQIFSTFATNVTVAGDFGPFITDGTNTFFFNCNTSELYYNSTAISGINTIPSLLNGIHYYTIMATSLGGTSWRLILLIDGVSYLDISFGEYLFSSGSVAPGFKATANDAYHYSADVWGYDSITSLEENPAPSTAPAPTSVSSVSYPVVSGSYYVAQMSFDLPAGYPGWCEGIRAQLTPHSSSPSTGDPAIIFALQPTGSYNLVWPTGAFGSAYDLYIGFEDNTAEASALYHIGTTVASPTGGTNTNPGDQPILASNTSSASLIVTGAHFDAIVSLTLTSTGTTSSDWLGDIEAVAIPTGGSGTTVYGKVTPNASGAYEVIWARMPYESQDLYLRFVDEEGNVSVATKILTVNPYTISEVQPPSSIPIQPTFDSGDTSIVPYANVVGLLQDFDCSITLTNVPQDQSVTRAVWTIRRTPTSSSTVPGQGGAYIKNVIPFYSVDAVSVTFNSMNAPAVGDLVYIAYCADGAISALEAGWTLAGTITNGAFVSGGVYKIWGSTDALSQIAINNTSGTNAATETIYIIGGVNQTSPIVQFETSALTSSATLAFAGLVPSELSVLPIASIFANTYQPTLSGSPTVPSGFTYDGYSSSTYYSSNYTVMSFGGSLASSLGAIGPSFTVPSTLNPGTTGADLYGMMVFVRSSDPGGVTPGVTFPWIYVTDTPLQGIPNPPEINAINYSYGQVSTGISYDMGVAYLNKQNILGPIGVFVSDYAATTLKVTNQYLEGGVPYVPQVSPGIPSSSPQPAPTSSEIATIGVSGNTTTATFGTAPASGTTIIFSVYFDSLTAGSIVTPPDGSWTLELAPTVSSDTAYPASLVIYSKTAGASEPTSYSFTWPNGDTMTDMEVAGYAEVWTNVGTLLIQENEQAAGNNIQTSPSIVTSEVNSVPIHFSGFNGTYTSVSSLPAWTVVTSGTGGLQVAKGPIVSTAVATTIQDVLTYSGASGTQSGINALIVLQPVPGSGAVAPVTVTPNPNGLSTNFSVAFQFLNQPLDGSLSKVGLWFRTPAQASTITTGWAPYGDIPAYGVGEALGSLPLIGNYQFDYLDLSNGISYDFGMTAEDLQGDNTAPVTYITTSVPANVNPVVVSTGNLVVDSDFMACVYGPGPSSGGLKHYTVSKADPYWYFYGIDAISWSLVGNGNGPEYTEFGNHMVQDSPTSAAAFFGISLPITVVPGYWYTVSATISYQGPNTSMTGGPFVAIVNSSGSNTYSTIYAEAHQPAGGNGVVSTNWFCPADGSVTTVAVMLNNDTSSLAIPYYLHMGKPMLQIGKTLNSYVSGPSTPGTAAVTQSLVIGNNGTTATQTQAGTLPTITSNTTTPTSGGGAPVLDQQPQGSIRINSAASSLATSLYVQTSATPTSPTWVAVASGATTLASLTDVSISSPTNKQLLRYNSGTSKWDNVTENLEDLGDVSISSPSTGQVVTWNGTAWIAATPSASTTFASLTDVDIASEGAGLFLTYDPDAYFVMEDGVTQFVMEDGLTDFIGEGASSVPYVFEVPPFVPTYNAAGVNVSQARHQISDSVTASGISTTVTLTGLAAFATAAYLLLILDETGLTYIAPSAQTASSFTFTSVASRTYTFFAIGN